MPIKKPEPTDDCVRPFFSSTRTCRMSARAAVYSFCAADEGGGNVACSVVAGAAVAGGGLAGGVEAVGAACAPVAEHRLASKKAKLDNFMHPLCVSRSAPVRQAGAASRSGNYRAPSSSAGAVSGVIM